MSSGTSERAVLSRDLADFLIELSIALHKHAMYPEGHPSLGPAAAALARRSGLLLQDRSTLSFGVARQQLVIEGVATDPKHPVLRELAGRLHRHHLGAVTFQRGADPAELADLLHALSVDAERSGQPLGLAGRAALNKWPHVRLHPVGFERLELVEAEATGEDSGAKVRADQLWVGLARAAMASDTADAPPPSTEPTVIAEVIDRQPADAGYDQAIVGYLLQIAQELRTAGGAEAAALRRRTSRLIGALRPETLQRLVEMGGDLGQRMQFALDASYGMAVDAVLEVLRAAAEASQQTISHSLVRMLSKLAAHAERGPVERRPLADAQLRDQVRSLISGWTLADPNPERYGTALQRLSQSAPTVAPPVATPPAQAEETADAARLIQMAIELGVIRAAVWRVVKRLVDDGRVGPLLDLLAEAPPDSTVAELIWERVAVPSVVRALCVAQPPDFRTLDRILPRLDAAALEPLLETLVDSDSRATRRGLLDRLTGVAGRVSDAIVRRLHDERWYVLRNMLVLLDGLHQLPATVVPGDYATHADPRVRREALKLRLKLPAERDEAIAAGIVDPDEHVARLALRAAQQNCSAIAVAGIGVQLANPSYSSELRILAVRVLGRATAPEALRLLLSLTEGGKTIFGRPKLPPKSPELVAALLALSAGWAQNARAQAVLRRAARSSDPEIRAAAGAGVLR